MVTLPLVLVKTDRIKVMLIRFLKTLHFDYYVDMSRVVSGTEKRIGPLPSFHGYRKRQPKD
jgi:hypothetical protein